MSITGGFAIAETAHTGIAEIRAQQVEVKSTPEPSVAQSPPQHIAAAGADVSYRGMRLIRVESLG